MLSAGIYFLVRTDGEGRAPLFDQMTKCGQNSSEFRKRFEGWQTVPGCRTLTWMYISHFSFLSLLINCHVTGEGWRLGSGEWRILVTLNHIHSNYCSSQLPSDGVKRRMINGNVEPLLCVRVSRWQSIVTPIHRNDQHTDWIVTADSLGKVNVEGTFLKVLPIKYIWKPSCPPSVSNFKKRKYNRWKSSNITMRTKVLRWCSPQLQLSIFIKFVCLISIIKLL